MTTRKPAAHAPETVHAPAAAGFVKVEVLRGYWPHGEPSADWVEANPERTEYRLLEGETVDLPAEEAMDVCEAGIARRVKVVKVD